MAFLRGGKGRVEGSKIWGNAYVNVGIKGGGSGAEVARCKCARNLKGLIIQNDLERFTGHPRRLTLLLARLCPH